MFISKKSLCALTVGLLGAVTISVTAINSHNISSFAGGITNTSEKGRTLTLDKDTPLTIDGTVGTLDIGNFRVYAPNCESLENGFVTLKDRCKLIIYCPNVEKNNKGFYRGFASSSISSVEIVSNNRNKTFTPRVIWGRTSDGSTIQTYEGAGWNSFNKTASNSNVTTTFTSSNGAFIKQQDTGKTQGYTCLTISTDGTAITLDLYSLTISFTCN